MKFRVSEIFSSIEGEGKRAGQFATFIRLAGCNLRCSYCDTVYAQDFDAGGEMELAQILDKARAYGNRNVTLTGGEPLANPHARALAAALAGRHEVNIETNGSLPLTPYLEYPEVFFTMDWKTPSSGCCDRMLERNFACLRNEDVLKIVMREEDFGAVHDFLQKWPVKASIYLGAVFGELAPARLVEFARSLLALPAIQPQKLRVQLQLHKYIWEPHMRGV